MLILSCTQPGDTVFVLFGGSGSEIEVCRRLGRNFLSAEIDPKYHEMILRRLQIGRIEEKYRLMPRREDEAQLALPVGGDSG